ncbi:thioesterase family protein [Actinocorallia sp. API 0066]|uniref:acyl-CoA thioesterase n=1 Tax=Actinocorallia sp. API 0066 TaxID=2896846 RepID=UPI001E4C92B7|nr:thioesterase family protein [Actinocorallia sp. API 0066]MCD0449239.1 thioesterase family protein [Actinocorallia sp. API 0066]
MTEIEALPHPFDGAIELTAGDDGLVRGRTRAEYMNMVGPFGGITAATLLSAVQGRPDCLGEPLSLTVNFAGPIADGEFEITARAVRTNRSTQHWALELVQDGAVATTATAVFGYRRDTWADAETDMPSVPAPEDIAPGGFPDFVAWARNYDFRFLDGALPGENPGEHPDSTTTVWVRDKPSRPLDFTTLTAMADIFYPRVFLRRGQFLPAGTVTLTVYFLADAAELAANGDAHLLGRARAHRFSRGFFDQSAQLWSRTGGLLATTHQLVYFKG